MIFLVTLPPVLRAASPSRTIPAREEVLMATATPSPACTLTLDAGERELLLPILEQALRDKLIETHRTEAFAARQLIQRQTDALQKLVDRLRRA
jgi:hypothetical protein